MQCEDRRGEFKQRVLAEFREKNIELPSDCEVDALADDLVRKCQGDATLDVSANSPDFKDTAQGGRAMTEAAGKRLQRVMLGDFDLAIQPIGGGTCAAGLELVPVKETAPGGMEISPGAKQLLGYLKELISAKYQHLNRANGRLISDQLSCPEEIGIGESKFNMFSFSGPVDKSFFNNFKIPICSNENLNPNKKNYWINIIDEYLGVKPGAIFNEKNIPYGSYRINIPFSRSNIYGDAIEIDTRAEGCY